MLFLASQEKPVSELLLLRLLLLILEYLLIYYQELCTDCISSKVWKAVGTYSNNFSKLQRLCSLQFLRSRFFNSLKCKNMTTFFPHCIIHLHRNWVCLVFHHGHCLKPFWFSNSFFGLFWAQLIGDFCSVWETVEPVTLKFLLFVIFTFIFPWGENFFLKES